MLAAQEANASADGTVTRRVVVLGPDGSSAGGTPPSLTFSTGSSPTTTISTGSSPTTTISTGSTGVMACDSKPLLLRAGQQAELGWVTPNDVPLEISMSMDPLPPTGAQIGAIERLGANKVRYRAPESVRANGKVLITAKAINADMPPASCEVTLMPDGDIAVADDGESEGLLGNVYQLPYNTQRLPDFDAMKPSATVLAPNLDVPNREFTQGFPGVRDIVEWFGIRFYGTLKIAEGGVWEFDLSSDDGSKLFIDDILVINNDGQHPVQSARGSVALSKGNHKIRVEYFQGPRTYIALQLFSRLQGKGEFTIVPPSAFARPLGQN